MRRRDVLRGSAALAVSVAVARVGTGTAATRPVAATAPRGALGWSPFTAETRPWTRWWWLGSAVTEDGLARHLRQFADVGFGGVEIQPIYEAQGYEDRVLTYLGDDWLAALDATTRHAGEHGLGVDLTTGSGWTFGGPWISPELSAGRALTEFWELGEGQRLPAPVRTTQPPHPDLLDEELLSRPDLRPPMDPLPEPPLVALVATEKTGGDTVDLTARVGADGTLDWTAPAGHWQLTAVFSGLVLKRVERAGPGGKGLMANYFDAESIQHHLENFGTALGEGPRGIRALFHDSFELERTDWTRDAVAEFARLRGYDLVPHLPEVFGDAGTEDTRSRVLSDVRETFSDLFLERFAQPWTEWSEARGWQTRNQAHGSPAHLLDVYGAADIPETEFLGGQILPIPGLREGAGPAEPPVSLVWRCASSPAHVLGKRLVGAESLTWRDEHFHVSLSQAKPTLDLLFTAGINHVVFHGTAYSPEDAPWPGLAFYAATELQPANPLWGDLPELTGYLTRCQSVLQSGEHDNDVLVYFSQHDLWAETDGGLGDGAEDPELTPDFTWQGTEWMYDHPSGAGAVARELERRGWQFDWVSDRQLAGFRGSRSGVRNDHGHYAVVLVPGTRLMPVETLERLHDLAADGATVVFAGELPSDVPGLADLDARRARLTELTDALRRRPSGRGSYRVGRGRIVVTEAGVSVDDALNTTDARREPIADSGLRVLRRTHDEGRHYFLVNATAERVDDWFPLGTPAVSVGALDALRDTHGRARTRWSRGRLHVRVALDPGESLILRTFARRRLADPVSPVFAPSGRQRAIEGPWTLRFREGGPALPAERTLTELVSWTDLGEAETNFSGTGSYGTSFELSTADAHRTWELDLGDVRECARVRLNGHDLGTAWALPFRLPVGDLLRAGRNVLELDVTNLAANRVRDLARRGELQANYYLRWRTTPPEQWEPMPSGLLGPVRLVESRGR
ncbi:glycosyl hydrolase [Prauserella cavernicola]|uniref:Alpha-L-rhamnosidase n=1 Tax=Prauserella cavernicola TaxID=2800127 RepID=A0A934QYF4_9PSEU|nr:glycosyl hydrolase [Prauserella cavernicola]MBK1789045.1 hypothetical protein [Prauserella cavernicola]